MKLRLKITLTRKPREGWTVNGTTAVLIGQAGAIVETIECFTVKAASRVAAQMARLEHGEGIAVRGWTICQSMITKSGIVHT